MRLAVAPLDNVRSVLPAIALAAITLSLLVPERAHAQQMAGVIIHWDAPPRCPQQSDLSDRVRRLSGSPTALQVAVQADGTITQTDDGRFHLKLLLSSGGLVAERNIDSTSCADLTRAAAVAIALLLHSEEGVNDGNPNEPNTAGGTAAHTEPAPTSSGSADHPQPDKTVSLRDTAASPNPSAGDGLDAQGPTAGRRWHARLRAPLAALGIGPLPRPEWGLTLAAGASYDSWRFWLEGTDWRHQVVPAKAFPGYSANVELLTASLKVCEGHRFSVFEIAPCVVVSLEHAAASGAGQNVVPQSQHVNWLGLGVGVQGSIRVVSWLSLTLAVDGQIEASRPRISIGGVGAVDQGAPGALTVTLGPEWIL
jgi:hypothetical protein